MMVWVTHGWVGPRRETADAASSGPRTGRPSSSSTFATTGGEEEAFGEGGGDAADDRDDDDDESVSPDEESYPSPYPSSPSSPPS